MIHRGDTLINPFLDDRDSKKPDRFDAIVSNPPYSIKWEGKKNITLENDIRYTPAGILAPQEKADMAFVMNSLYYLAPSGTAAIVCFPGILFRDGAEQIIRKYLVQQNYVHAVIALPDKLFFGTGIATCILVLKKNKTNDNNVLFIDASNEFIKSGKFNKLSKDNITNILNALKERQNKEGFSALISNEIIENNNCNLSPNTWLHKQTDEETELDIEKINKEVEEIATQSQDMRKKINKLIGQMQQCS